MTTAPLEDRVTNLESLMATKATVSQVAELRARSEQRHQAVLEEFGLVHAKLAQHDVRFDSIDARFDGIDARLDGMDARFDGIDARLDGMDARFDGIDARLDGMDARFDGIDARLDGMDARFDGIDTRLDGIDARLDTQGAVLETHTALLNRILDRLPAGD